MLISESLLVKEIDKVPKDPNNPSIKVTNKIFAKVSRIYAKSELKKSELILDINSDLLILKEGDQIEILMCESPFEDKNMLSAEKNTHNFNNVDDLDFAKNYEYVMHGVIFHSGIEENRLFIYASFGGLLLKYFGIAESIQLDKIKLDKKILLMIKTHR